MLLVCEECGTHQDYSIMETDVTCPECGAGEEFLQKVDGEAEHAPESGPPYTVLLAEDEAEMRRTYRIWLSEDDRWEIREASDGDETLAELDETVDVLVLDRRMPAVSGPEVVERLDETGFGGNVLVVSAYEEDAHLSEADADVAGYLTKPVREETFCEALERVLA